MAKHKKKKKHAASQSPIKLAQQAHSAVEKGNYRQAESLYRNLVKKDAQKYMPDLIRVQEKLLLQLCYEKDWRAAKRVIAALQKIDPENQTLQTTHICMALSQGEFDKAGRLAAQSIVGADKTDPQASAHLSDALVMAFCAHQGPQDLPHQIENELNWIYLALEQVSRNAPDEALSQVKQIGLRSIFSNWKLYIKGICAYYKHEDQKALTAFNKLTVGTVPGKASWPYRMLLNGTKVLPSDIPSAQLNRDICLLTGEAKNAEILSRAEYLWGVGRYRDSFKHLAANLEEFPTQKPGLNQCLTSFCYGAYRQIPNTRALNYLNFLNAAAIKKRRGNSYEKFKATQAMALYLEKEAEWDEEIVEVWETVLTHYHAIEKEAAPADAMVYIHMGDIFSQEEPDDDPLAIFGFSLGPKKETQLRNAELAQECFQKALEAKPDSREAHLALLNLYEKTGNKSKINQTLDRIIKIFPDEKDVLHKAGLRCMERGALIKGMKYLEKALLLDPIDRRLRSSFVLICINAALSYVAKKNLEKCIESLKRAESRASRTSDDLIMGLPFLYARWAVVLQMFKNKTGAGDSDKMLAKALSICKDPLKVHYFTWLISRCYNVAPKVFKKSRETVQKGMALRQDPAFGAVLVNLLKFCVAGFENRKPEWFKSEIKSINEYLLKAANPECRHEDAQDIIAYAMEDGTRNIEIARTYIGLILDREPDNARFRWFQFLSAISADVHPSQLMHRKDELEEIIALAERQGDHEITQAARQTRSHIEGTVKAFEEFKQCFGDWDDDEFFDEEDDFFDEEDDDDFFSDDFDGSGIEMKEEPEPASSQEQLDLFDFLDPELPKK